MGFILCSTGMPLTRPGQRDYSPLRVAHPPFLLLCTLRHQSLKGDTTHGPYTTH